MGEIWGRCVLRPADLEADYAFLSPEPALESVTRLPLYSRPYSAVSTALAASVLTRCSEYSHGTRYMPCSRPELLVHSTRRTVVGSPRPQPAGSKPSARSGGRLTRMMADASEQEARACELLSSSLTATADARRAHRFLSSGALPFSHCVPRCHAVCAAIWERTSLSHTRQNYV